MTGCRRKEDWPARLTAFVAGRRRTPFAWGRNDCCLFAADAVAAMTGVDPAKPWRGYKTVRGAMNRVRRAGGVPGLMAQAAQRHGWPSITATFARRGDIVLAATPDGPALAVRFGHGVVLPGSDGLLTLPLDPAASAWRVG